MRREVTKYICDCCLTEVIVEHPDAIPKNWFGSTSESVHACEVHYKQIKEEVQKAIDTLELQHKKYEVVKLYQLILNHMIDQITKKKLQERPF